jgi:hypothetical protein
MIPYYRYPVTEGLPPPAHGDCSLHPEAMSEQFYMIPYYRYPVPEGLPALAHLEIVLSTLKPCLSSSILSLINYLQISST